MIFNKLLKTPNDVFQVILDSIEDRRKLLLTYLNQHSYNIYYEHSNYRKVLDEEFMIYQADLGIYLALRILGINLLSRLNGTDLNYLLLKKISQKTIPIVLVGGKFEEEFVFTEAKKRGIKVNCYINGYFSEEEEEHIIKNISQFDANVIMVGMGVPKQELFAHKVSQHLGNCIIICVGNFFEFYFGTKKRTPVFIRKLGLEWFFRLLNEPGRLWKRYIRGIPVFFYRILKLKYQTKGKLYPKK